MAIIKAELAKDTYMYLDLTERITFIAGDSGTGKTYIVDALDDISKNPDIAKIEGIKPEQIVILKDSNDVHKLSNTAGKIVFIDRYDIYTNEAKKKVWKALSSNQGIFIIMSRFPDIPYNFGFSKKSFKELKVNRAGALQRKK